MRITSKKIHAKYIGNNKGNGLLSGKDYDSTITFLFGTGSVQFEIINDEKILILNYESWDSCREEWSDFEIDVASI